MKNYLLILILFATNINAQVSGRFIIGDSSDIVFQTTILQTGDKTEPDFDGYFSVHIPDRPGSYDLFIDAGQIDFKIENITEGLHVINLGDIELPFLKTISVEQYNEVQEIDKVRYVPIYHWTSVVAYYDKFTLARNYITFFCKGVKHQTDQFTYNPEERLISIDANSLVRCDN